MALSANRALLAATLVLAATSSSRAQEAPKNQAPAKAPPAQPPRQAAPLQAPPMEVGPLPLRGYDLREAKLDPPMTVVGKDGKVEQKRFGWQVVVKGDHFPVRALDPILWLDDVKLERYDRCQVVPDAPESLVYTFHDPRLLRSEHVMQLIYGKDERTRTKFMERFDPERLVRLPDATRKELGMPELEFLTLTQVGADGSIAGRSRLSEGEVRLALRSADGTLLATGAPVALGADGSFAAKLGVLPGGATHVAALLVASGQQLPTAPMHDLPRGVELLDMKPVTR